MADLYALDIDNETVSGSDGSLMTLDIFRRYYINKDPSKKFRLTSMLNRLVNMNFDIEALRKFYEEPEKGQ